MASSRKSQSSPKSAKRIAVALSGGLDSVVLLDTICKSQAANQNREIYAFHIHHGLQKPADDWLIFCERLAKKYKIHFDFRLLHLNTKEGNVEARARAARYEALADLCEEYGIEDLLLAHHQNDQAETVLLQLLRGAGVAGLSGMSVHKHIQAGSSPLILKRPLLDQSRAELEAYAKQHKLKWIEDPSNQDRKYRRNAIRKDVIPKLEKIQPEAVANLARSASLLSDAQALLDRLALQDGKGILIKDCLQLIPLLGLYKADLPAANNVLRYWLKMNELSMPSQERLNSWWRDLLAVKVDSQLEWTHDGKAIRLWRDQLQLAPQSGGQWIFRTISTGSKNAGLPAAWVKKAQKEGRITTKARSGSEKLQIKPNSPRKTLKNLFQEGDIPPWQRNAPLLYIDHELIAVAGVGVSYPHLVLTGSRVWPEWQEKAL
ncbi:tRNA lysidine(34) synthetase TilS [Polynucleobacter sp. QLW-P1DATA-2]|uniref:tRNA lysidine(34) synthetase TilS n=1 Tax=unclassified Polynucleobacter TaxID=2640945 RepID=UPI0008F87DE1|nr:MULTISPECIES: tRNA lysidine(34) synthetase TilS [unclassified Polynucleobacter]OIM98626.1 tRNA lysidine(34) synthetase TilS [Polynucleobacter sp. MWH-Tro8-2-5-gr]OIN00524.1 tRNA lysidine(34) synthetase TilS [Polynucleobacter sp. QLW-P1DATA-2]